MTSAPNAAAIRAIVGHRATLTEPEAQEITRAIGIDTPAMVLSHDPAEAARAVVPGKRAVVKVVGPAHKTDLGGVRVVDNQPDAIRAAAEAMAAIAGIGGFLVAEWIDHDPAAEILAGVRWTDAFGPVVTIGPGGVSVGEGLSPAIIASATSHLADATLRAAPGTRRLTRARRGSPAAVRGDDLASIAHALGELGRVAMPHDLTEYEINPLVFTASGPIALDALAVTGRGPGEPPPPPRPREGIDRQLHPRSIAVMGVSRTMNPGRAILRNLIAAGFPAGRITVVKPGADSIDGCACIPDLDHLAEPVDLLIVAVGAPEVPDAMQKVVASGSARSVILIAGGFGERPGTEAAADALRRTIVDARRAGRPAPVVTGANSMGIRSTPGAFDATFIPPDRMTPGPGRSAPVAVIAQSGAFTLSRLDRLPWLRPDYVVTVGNQLDLTTGDYLDRFADDPDIAVVACYVEGFAAGDGDRVLRAAIRIRGRGGVVVWHRGGRSPVGAGAAASHTAAVATDDLVTRSLAATAGILETGSLDEFEDVLRVAVLLRDRPIRGRRVGVVSNAGFESVAAADALGGLEAAAFSPITTTRLGGVLDGGGIADLVTIRNPLDLTPAAADATFADAVAAVLDDPGVDVAVIGCVPFSPSLTTLADDPGSLPDRLVALAAHPTPWLAVVDAGRRYDPMVDRLEAAGIPVMRTMDRAVRLFDIYAGTRLGLPG